MLGSGGMDDGIIYGCRFENGDGQGFATTISYRMTIENNKFYNVGNAISGEPIISSRIVGNRVIYDDDGDTAIGIWVRKASASAILPHNNIIAQNYIYNTTVGADNGADQGIQLRDGSYNRIIGNHIEQMGEHGITIKSDAATADYNIIENNVVLNANQDNHSIVYGINLQVTNNSVTHTIVRGNHSIVTDATNSHTRYGVYEGTGADYNLIEGNDLTGNETAGVRKDGTNSIVRNNIGFVTEAKGTGSIASGATTAVITHGLGITPSAANIHITLTENPTNTPGAVFVTSITSTQFTVNVENDPGASNLDFSWQASII